MGQGISPTVFLILDNVEFLSPKLSAARSEVAQVGARPQVLSVRRGGPAVISPPSAGVISPSGR